MNKYVVVEKTFPIDKLMVLNETDQMLSWIILERITPRRFTKHHKAKILAIRKELSRTLGKKRSKAEKRGNLREDLVLFMLDACRASNLLPWIYRVEKTKSRGRLDRQGIDIVITDWKGSRIYLQVKSTLLDREKHICKSLISKSARVIPCVVINERDMDDSEILLEILLELLTVYTELGPRIIGKKIFPSNSPNI